MPTVTFLNLPENKKEKIVQSAKKEFSRVNITEVSIKNIVEDAQIARGSFYQYFEDKEDLLQYLLKNQMEGFKEKAENTLIKSKGDIFEAIIKIYDYIIEAARKEENIEFYKKVFENIKAGEESIFSIKIQPVHKQEYKNKLMQLINTSMLNIQNDEDKEIIMNMIIPILRSSLIHAMKHNCENKEKERQEFVKKIEYLKHGILKK